MELTNEVYSYINNYFSVLKYTGYKSYNEVNKLLACIFIEEMLYGPMSKYITDKDYDKITNAMQCLYGSCMIPYPEYKESYSSVINKMPDSYRATEDNILRDTEIADWELRVKC